MFIGRNTITLNAAAVAKIIEEFINSRISGDGRDDIDVKSVHQQGSGLFVVAIKGKRVS